MDERKTCIFCPNPLDSSDEHIIPESINGRLHSKEIICHDCNNKFGSKVDTILSESFSLFIHMLELKNARTVYVEDPEGRKYTKDKKNKIKPVKPEISIQKKNGLLYINIQGDEKNALKLLEKQKKKFQLNGGDPIKLEIKRDSLSQPPLSIEISMDIDSRLTLVLNKIALEFYAYNNLDLSSVQDLLDQVGKLDFTLSNVTICNLKQESRTFEDGEVSHFLYLKTDENKKLLYCYVELFNIVCAVVILKTNYTGPEINIQHRQDVITGKILKNKVDLVVDFDKLSYNVLNVSREDFSILVDLFCERHHERIFRETLDNGLKQIQEELKGEISSGVLKQEDYENRFIKLSAEYIAYLTVHEFPYAVSDLDDNQDEMINYIHSSMKEKMFDEFCSLNKTFIGFRIAFTSENHDPEKCVVVSFLKTPVGDRNGEKIVKVYCVLKNEETGQLKYIPFRNLFEGLRRLKEEQEGK